MVLDPVRRKITGEAYTDSSRRKEETEKIRGSVPPTPVQKESTSGGENIQVSDKAQMMSRIMKAIAEIADVRADLVAEIKERIERDEYHVPGEAIAENMIRQALTELKSLGNS